jgi:acyl-[acyl-carrier-protein]-phospholipid O-acyltransferase / long-chain-fatty-acid--[acyl-carrier-protein] ligase
MKKSGFAGLLITQALGALNDNAFKTFIVLIALATMPIARSAMFIAVAGACFVIPFIIFSTFAGTLADKFGKKRLIVWFKIAELFLMALSIAAIYYQNMNLLMIMLFLMGAQSAFFGPVKLAILPELLPDSELSRANGLMSMMTFMGIILGTASAGMLIKLTAGKYYLGSLFFVFIAVLGVLSSLFVGNVKPAGSDERFEFNFFGKIVSNIKDVKKHHTVYLALMAGAYFWFLGTMFQMNILLYGKGLMHVSESTLSLFQMIVAVGIGLGSVFAGKLSRDKVELGLVPVGALGLVVFGFLLAFSFHSVAQTSVYLFLFGMSGGFYILPLQVFVQQRSPKEERGKFIATGNVLSFIGVLIASSFLWLFNIYFKLNPGQIFIVVAVMTFVVAGYVISVLPEFLVRLVVYPITNIVYRLKTLGSKNVPIEGGALLVSNHVSLVDAFLLTGACQRPIRFIMHKKFYEIAWFKWFFKAMGCIPISHRDGPREIVKSLQTAREALKNGDIVCIFIEGEISRHGQMLGFKSGYERIVKGLDVPIIPVHIDGVWGRMFSYQGGDFIFKWPRDLGYPVSVSFGSPLTADIEVGELRKTVVELSSNAFVNRLSNKDSLALSFVRSAKKRWFSFAMSDSGGKRLNFGSTFIRASVLAKTLSDTLKDDKRVGLLLPPSAGGAITNIAVSLLGKVPVNLNYTNSREDVIKCAQKAEIEKIIVSKKLLQKLSWSVSENMIFIEDIALGISKLEGFLTSLILFILPFGLLKKFYFQSADVCIEDEATVIFTSGSTGEPKGVMLSHSNIHSNIEALAQIYQMSPSDKILGILPFFHSFGYSISLWLPLIVGFGSVYHYNPLDSKRIGDLVEKNRITMLIATPTFLVSYMRRIPAEKFSPLRLVVTGAEKLRREIAAAFEDKFGISPLEGYGATELSPVAALNIPDFDSGKIHQTGTKYGTIGHPIPGVAMKTVDMDTFEPLPNNVPGLLLVKGPNVMKGYLGEPEKTKEVIKDGYYVTGDMASIDDDGFVTITDRLSRFSKIGGEMVPHIKIEERLQELSSLVERNFVVTSVPDEKKGEKIVVLYRDYRDIDVLHEKLCESDLPKLWLPDRNSYHKLDEFPLLGSGKLDMKRIREIAKEKEGF